MASKRLGSSLEESTNATKKPKIEIPPIKAFCGISDITPQTATLPQEPGVTTSPIATTDNSTIPTIKQPDNSLTYTWVVIEHWHPKDPSPDMKSMVAILGVFNNVTAALEHAEEHTRALYIVTNHGIRSPPTEEDDRVSEGMSPTSVYERRMEYFRGEWEREEEEDLEDGLKKWTVYWGDVTEVWVEKRQVCETKDEAGYFTPLPVDDDVPGKDW
jgi:hypothetical protein